MGYKLADGSMSTDYKVGDGFINSRTAKVSIKYFVGLF